MSQRTRDLTSAAALSVLAIAVFWIARGIEPRLPTGVDSGFFPEIASAALLIVAVVIAITGVLRPDTAASAAGPDQGQAGTAPVRPNPWRVGICVVLMVAFVALLPYLGFPLAAVLFLLAQITVLAPPGQRSMPLIALVSVLAGCGIYAVFALGFGLILPRGPF